MYEIKFIPEEELNSILPFLQMLNEKTAIAILQQRIDAIKDYHYHCVGIFDNGKLIGISGVWILFKFYNGKHIEADNVIVHPDYRGKNVGEILMQWIHTYAKENECEVSELNCYVANHRGHKFWMNLGYEIIGFHMRKVL